jgi:hypothetical protein
MAPYAGDHSEAHIRDLSAAEMMTCTGCGYPFLVVAHICTRGLYASLKQCLYRG